MRIYCELFISFFKIGAFTLGGGYVMIPLIEKEVVENKKWISHNDFSDTLTLAQSAPGPISINTAIFVGYKIKGIKGVIATTMGTIIPSFTIILIIAIFFVGLKDNSSVEKIFRGVRPATVALIAVPVINMLKELGFKYWVVIIAVISALAVWLLNISPILVIVLAGIFAIIYNTFLKK